MYLNTWTILALASFALAQVDTPTYQGHMDPWFSQTRPRGRRVAIKAWWEYGCARQSSEIGQVELVPGNCKNYKTQPVSIMWATWPRPKKPGKDDYTVWNCTLSVFDEKDCKGAMLVQYHDKDTAEKCIPASSPGDTDMVGRSVTVHCYGKTGHQIYEEEHQTIYQNGTQIWPATKTLPAVVSSIPVLVTITKDANPTGTATWAAISTSTATMKTKYSTVWVTPTAVA